MLPADPCSGPIGIAGAGRLARALGRLLREQGEPVVCVASRDPGRALEAAGFIGGGAVPVAYSELPLHASRFLIAVADSALPHVAEALAGGNPRGGVALHTCGAKGPEELAAMRALGVSCGTLHPLQTVSDLRAALTSLPGSAFAIAGDEAAVQWAERIVERLSGVVVNIRPGARPLYHAAAAMASNHLAALIDAAQQLMAAATGQNEPAALRALAPLIRASIVNVLDRGPAAALTGPIERGDADTVALHLEALASAPPRILELYRVSGLRTLDLARRKGLAAGPAARLEEMLRGTENQ